MQFLSPPHLTEIISHNECIYSNNLGVQPRLDSITFAVCLVAVSRQKSPPIAFGYIEVRLTSGGLHKDMN